jgi:predicted PurR-regulated permease PerM
VLGLVPPDLRGSFLYFIREANHTLRAVLRGQILVITLLAILYATAFYFSGLPAGIIIGLLTGFARLVPYMDLLVGGSLSGLVLVANHAEPPLVIAVLASFLFIQILDGLFLTPRIMGQFSGLHPFLIVLSVFCFGDWFGFYGVLLAIPIAAFLRVLFHFLIEAYKESQFFKNGF